MIEINKIHCGDNCELMMQLPKECIDLVVTSPPYDDLRTYGGHSWDFFGVAWNLHRVLKPGGVIVWVVADATKNGSETGTSMEQAMHFKRLGLNLHDTMIFHRKTIPQTHRRYEQEWEYMFVLSKGAPKTWNGLVKKSIYAGRCGRTNKHREKDAIVSKRGKYTQHETSLLGNVWTYYVAGRFEDVIAYDHPAIFPERLARDHIYSWSNPGDLVLDPFAGSGTTCKAAKALGRNYIGLEINSTYCAIAERRLAQEILGIDAV